LRTITTPTEQTLVRCPLAVSKSMAAKSVIFLIFLQNYKFIAPKYGMFENVMRKKSAIGIFSYCRFPEC
jgi:hypothetical protein